MRTLCCSKVELFLSLMKKYDKMMKTTIQLRNFLREMRFQLASGTFRKRILWGRGIAFRKSLTGIALLEEEKTKKSYNHIFLNTDSETRLLLEKE